MSALGADRADSAPPGVHQVGYRFERRSPIVDHHVIEPRELVLAEKHERTIGANGLDEFGPKRERADDEGVEHRTVVRAIDKVTLPIQISIRLVDDDRQVAPRALLDEGARELCEIRGVEFGQNKGDEPRTPALETASQFAWSIIELLDRLEYTPASRLSDVYIAVHHVTDRAHGNLGGLRHFTTRRHGSSRKNSIAWGNILSV